MNNLQQPQPYANVLDSVPINMPSIHHGGGGAGARGDTNNTNPSSNNQTIDVGTPRHPTGWSSTTIRYHNFPHLPHKKGDSIDSSPFRVHGLDWYLRIHPGGAASAQGDGMVSMYLRCKSAAEQNVAVQAEFSLAMLRNDGQIDSMMSCPCNAFRRKRKGWPNFISRSRVLDGSCQLLDEYGALTVIVKIQLFQERDTNFIPKNEIGLIRLLEEVNNPTEEEEEEEADGYRERSSTANSADVKFIVEGGETIHAHRLILKLAAPTLAHLCEDVDEDTAIPIPRVRSPIFQGVLRFAYGDAVPEEVWRTAAAVAASNNDCDGIISSPAMELLDAANRFGVVGLKILAETKVAESELSISSASDLILYADGHNCPLLKERVIDFFVAHAIDIRKHPSYQKVTESPRILDELMEALLTKRILRSFSLGDNDVDYDSMGVNLLRDRKSVV